MRAVGKGLVLISLIAGGALAQLADAQVLADRPVHVDETGRSPDGPLSATETAYDTRLRSSMSSALAFQGPMDGGWVLVAGSRELFAFQLVDRDGLIAGAWRDPARPGALEASGFVDQVERTALGLTLRFADRTIELRRGTDGQLIGEFTVAARTERVTLRRRDP